MLNIIYLNYTMKTALTFLLTICFLSVFAQQSSNQDTNTSSPPDCFTASEDHQRMMEQLGITKIRPGKSGNESSPNAANYDQTKANPFPQLPELLESNDGKKITTAKMWWEKRRPEIAEDFEREVYGRIPENVPEVKWELEYSERELIGWTPVSVKKLIGKVDNSSYTQIAVNISMVVVTPENANGPVPLLMMYGQALPPAPTQPNREDFEKLNTAFKEILSQDSEIKAIFDKYPAYNPLVRPEGVSSSGYYLPVSGDTPRTHELIQAGWGYAMIDPSSIQPDNGEGLTCSGIIGLVNKGKPRKPDDWGALRAWSWGAARGLDYLQTDSAVDAKHIGIEGVSRYGKAALVTMAFEERFAFGLIGSSGKGGTTLHRRNFGEAVENLSGGFYYWMAGNYIKYSAEEGELGHMDASDLPVDSHQLIAMCAPRPLFISYGIPEAGDAHWLDQHGSYMAAIAAGPAYKLLGVKDLGVSNDYLTEKMPPVKEGLLDGQLAWRQHDGGHTDAPNIKHFIEWANKQIEFINPNH